MTLVFKKRIIMKAGINDEYRFTEEEIKTTKFRNEIPLLEDNPAKQVIGKVINLEYYAPTKSIRGDLVFKRRPYFSGYKPMYDVKETKKGHKLILRAVLSSKSGKEKIKYARMNKNIRKHRRDIY